MKKMTVLLVALLVSVLFWNCTDDVTNPVTDPVVDVTGSNQLANAGMSLMSEKMANMHIAQNPQNGNDVFSQTDYNSIKGKFTEALRLNPNNTTANFGMGILELASINYDNELWTMMTDIDSTLGKKRIFNNQVKMVLDLPRFWLEFNQNSLKKGNALTLARVQNLIDQRILPKISSGISYLDKAIGASIIITNEEESYEVDNGEIYLLRSSLYAVKSVMQMITLYDMDLLGTDNTYNWTNDLPNSFSKRVVVQSNDTLYFNEYDNSFKKDSIIAVNLKHNLTVRTGFMKIRSGNSAAAIKQSLLGFLNDIEKSATYIESETDDQDNDLIKDAVISDLNSGISGLNDGIINWNFTSIQTLIASLTSSINGTPFTVTSNGNQFSVNVGVLFVPGITDMKELLPYHSWKAVSDWKKEELEWGYIYYNNNSSGTYYDYNTGITYTGVNFIAHNNYEITADPIQFLNAANGTVINSNTNVYLPDYTFKGLFPGFDRAKFYTIFG